VLVVAFVAVDVTVSSVVSEVDSDAVVEATDEVPGDSATTDGYRVPYSNNKRTFHFCTIPT